MPLPGGKLPPFGMPFIIISCPGYGIGPPFPRGGDAPRGGEAYPGDGICILGSSGGTYEPTGLCSGDAYGDAAGEPPIIPGCGGRKMSNTNGLRVM